MEFSKNLLPFKKLLNHFYLSNIPNKKDNIKQIIIKLLFLISVIALITFTVLISSHFIKLQKNQNILNVSRDLRNEISQKAADKKIPFEKRLDDLNKAMLKQNKDYKAWITINGTKIDNPVFLSRNNSFYLNHNQLKQESEYGALFFDCETNISKKEADKNLVIYGNNMPDGSMFGELYKYKSLSFYKQNPLINLTTEKGTYLYKIYAVFVLNSSKKDDNNYIYNIYRKNFLSDDDFDSWVIEATERSIITTNVSVLPDDEILTLVTHSNDFPNARLVVMSRKVRWNEDVQTVAETGAAVNNPNPRYPKLWYDTRNLKYPFN